MYTRSSMSITHRVRKSKFVRLFDKTPDAVFCPHFYELILSNGCPYDCSYCYLNLTFRGNKLPVVFTNPWEEIQKELKEIPSGYFVTGELADSLAVIPPTLPQALDWFSSQQSRYLLLLTKSTNIKILLNREPSPQIVVSFSVNSMESWSHHEHLTPDPLRRLKAAAKLKEKGWRIRIRLDPIILDGDNSLPSYHNMCREISQLSPELVTVGSLRQYPGLFRFARQAPKYGLTRSRDGRMRYSFERRLFLYRKIADWLGFQPSLCKEPLDIWQALRWNFMGCNCTSIDRK